MAKHDNWQTPPALITALRREFTFALDAAADATNKVCENFISAEQDSLITPWGFDSTVWCNPPYSRLKDFTERALEESDIPGNTIVLLVPAYTDTKWWNDLAFYSNEIRFLVGRLRFWENGAPGKDTARFPSALAILRPSIPGLQNRTRHTYWNWRVGD